MADWSVSMNEGYKVNFYHIWLEGYAATGEHGPAQYLGYGPGKDFPDACRRMLIAEKWDLNGFYNPEENTYWGCKFYDNEADARRFFG